MSRYAPVANPRYVPPQDFRPCQCRDAAHDAPRRGHISMAECICQPEFIHGELYRVVYVCLPCARDHAPGWGRDKEVHW